MKIEQSELRDSARDLLDGLATADSATAWGAIGEAGWTLLSVPENQGGLDQPFSASAWLYLELGRALSSAPLLPSLLASEALRAASAGGDWLERILGGERIAASLIEPMPFTGKLSAVQGASDAGHVLIAATDLLAIVPIDAATVTPHPLWDTSRDLADVAFGTIDDGWVIARGERAQAAATALSIHLHFAIATDSVGAAEAVFEQTVDYLKTRRQYDRPLAMFQALKHRCADLKTMVAATDALVADHLALFDSGAGNVLARAKAAKAIGSGTFRAVAEEAVQLAGGIGMTAEYPTHRYLKRALLNEQLASPNDACEIAVAEDLLRGMAA